MSALAVILELSALLVLVASGGTAAISASALLCRPLIRRIPAALRADALFVLILLPSVAAAAAVTATLAPSVLAVLGLGDDHCGGHGHHAHLCVVHSDGGRPALIAIGALCLAVIIFRIGWVVGRALGDARRLRQLEALSQRSRHAGFDLFHVPGESSFCHAAGVARLRMYVSETLVARLTADECAAALAHETAHLRRRDPLRLLLMQIAECFVVPAFTLPLRQEYELATEQACDADAVREGHDETTVAAALVRVARELTRPLGIGAAAFGAGALDLRVRALLASAAPGPRVPLLLLLCLLLWVAALPLGQASVVHHAAETALHLLF